MIGICCPTTSSMCDPDHPARPALVTGPGPARRPRHPGADHPGPGLTTRPGADQPPVTAGRPLGGEFEVALAEDSPPSGFRVCGTTLARRAGSLPSGWALRRTHQTRQAAD